MQGRNRDAVTGNRHVDTGGEVGGMNWKIGININPLPCVIY